MLPVLARASLGHMELCGNLVECWDEKIMLLLLLLLLLCVQWQLCLCCSVWSWAVRECCAGIAWLVGAVRM
jgi:hypothetical protein